VTAVIGFLLGGEDTERSVSCTNRARGDAKENAKSSSRLGWLAWESITPALPKRHAVAGAQRLIRTHSIVFERAKDVT
jgi:hypothetical protein